MATPGKVKGIDYVFVLGTSPGVQVVGQLEGTLTVGDEPVDATNKSGAGWIESLDGATTSQQVVFTGSIHYNTNADFETIRAAAFDGTHLDGGIVAGASGETLYGKFQAHGLSDTAPVDGSPVTTSITFSSSGEVTRTVITTTP